MFSFSHPGCEYIFLVLIGSLAPLRNTSILLIRKNIYIATILEFANAKSSSCSPGFI